MAATGVVRDLLRSEEPSVRWRTRIHVLREEPDSRTNRRLQQEIRRSARARALIDGSATESYRKWQGRHWALQSLAELGYPPGDDALQPLVDSVLKTWLHERYYREYDPTKQSRRPGVPVIDGRYRRCGSQQGGALLALTRLGFAGADTDRLVERLMHWQWPDGGWNCHLKPTAATSSVYETLLPMRGLVAAGASAAADRAAEVLLSRRLLYRRSTGTLIRKDWAVLHYPVYWHYDVLAALKGLAEAGRLDDPRCGDALELLESKRLPDGSWPAEAGYVHGIDLRRQHFELVDWGPVGRARRNEWVTVDALAVLTAAGRLTG